MIEEECVQDNFINKQISNNKKQQKTKKKEVKHKTIIIFVYLSNQI